jgi:hypothetical protein
MALDELEATSGGGNGDFELPPAGNHPGLLVLIAELGTQTREIMGKVTQAREVYLCWQFPFQENADAPLRYFLIGKRFTYSFHTKSALRQLVEAWRGKPYQDGEKFHISKILGQPCLINVVHSTGKENRTFANLKGIAPLPRGTPVPQVRREPTSWEISTGKLEDLADLPYSYGAKVADLVSDAPEWKARVQGARATTTGGTTTNGATATPVASETATSELPF